MTKIELLRTSERPRGQQVLPLKLWIDWNGTPVLFAPVSALLLDFLNAEPAVAASATVRRAGRTVLFHPIALADGTPFPYALALAPDAALEPLVRAEPIDPASGHSVEIGRALDLFLFPVFVDAVEGAGKLFAFVLPARHPTGELASAGELVTQVEELKAAGAHDVALTVQIEKNRPQIAASSPAGLLHVGRTLALPFSIALQRPDPENASGLLWDVHPDFDSGGFTSYVAETTGVIVRLGIDQPSRMFTNRWGRTEDTPIPYNVLVESVHPSGDDPPLRLIEPGRLRERGRYAGYERYRFPQGLGEYLAARRPGPGLVRVSQPALFATGVEPASVEIPVEVQPVTLILTLTSQDAVDGSIVIEDRWREADGVLVAGFSVKVSVPAAAAPPDASPVVYDSDARPAYISATVSPGEVVISVVLEETEAPSLFGPFGDNVRRSFRIHARIADTAVAQFWLPPDATAGGPQGDLIGDLRDVIRAVGPGTTGLTVELLPIPEPLPEECVQYDMPPARTMSIFVPEPLEAELTSWIDPYFTGANELVFGGPVQDVIYATGTVTGIVHNHREGSQSERIVLEVRRPDGEVLRYEHDRDHQTLAIDSSGQVEQAVGRLAWTGNSGENQITLTAWKPINEVVGAGESVDPESLNAVLPAEPDIAFASTPGDGVHIVQRTLPDVTWTMELATSASLQDVTDAGVTSLASDTTLAYERRDKVTHQPVVPRRTGRHRIQARAENDFGSTPSEPLDLWAEAPRVAPTLRVPVGYAGKYRTPNQVGHSVARVTAEVVVRYALTFATSGPGLDDERSLSAPFQDRTVTLDLPTPPDELAVGNNGFTFTGTNDFADTSAVETVRRRGEVYDFDQVTVSLECLHENRYIRADVLLDGQQIDHVEQSFRVIWTVGPVSESSSPLGFDLIQFEILRQDDDGDLVSSSSALLVAIETVGLVGPDYEALTVVISLPDSRVQADDRNVPAGTGRWFRVVVRDGSSGDIPVEVVGL